MYQTLVVSAKDEESTIYNQTMYTELTTVLIFNKLAMQFKQSVAAMLSELTRVYNASH